MSRRKGPSASFSTDQARHSPHPPNPHFLTGSIQQLAQGWISTADQWDQTHLHAWLATQPHPSVFAPLTFSVMFPVSTTRIGYFADTQDGAPLNSMMKFQKVRGGLWSPTLMMSSILSQRTCGTKFCSAKILHYAEWDIFPMTRQRINYEVVRQLFAPQRYKPDAPQRYLPQS